MSRFLRTFEANPPKRHGKMDKQIELSQTEIELAFASFCIEGTVQAAARDESEVTGDIEIVQDAFGEDCRFGCRQHQDAPLPGCLF